MNAIDQYNSIISLERSLVPAPSLIDGRTEKDWLSFLCDYATLINFYNGNNTLSGDWSPFLLKDPVFLLASISKTRFSEHHSLYMKTAEKLHKLLRAKAPDHDIADPFNRLFDQLTDIFVYIKRWVYFMQRTDDEYDLKTYVIDNIKTNFSKYFWAIISLQQGMYLSRVIKGINPVNYNKFHFFDAYEEQLWMQNKDRSPYWEILGLKHPIIDNTHNDLLNAIIKAGDDLFSFFYTIINHSGSEFERVKTQQSRYPDITLLRTFVNLLKIQQDKLNSISQKHLDFYYKDILKQTEKKAISDEVFLCSQLAKTTSTFNLPGGTMFSAGNDAQKNPIWFSTQETVQLNPAVIARGYTLSRSLADVTPSPFYLKNIPPAGIIQKDKSGKIQSWETFGGSASPSASLVTPGFALASPMLFLREGIREISLTMVFENEIDPRLLDTAVYYLSTASAWVKVTGKVDPPLKEIVPQKEVTVLISLDASIAPIVSFSKNPDGLDSPWPMLKIEFNTVLALPTPPYLTSATIAVTVSGMKTFDLYSDSGALSTKTPYPLFGPMPLVNNSFIIGSNEIFSKPFKRLTLELNWDNLPENFAAYYSQYDKYTKEYSMPKETIWTKIKQVFTGKHNESDPLFDNTSFTVDFGLLQDGTWKKFDMFKYYDPANPMKCDPRPTTSDIVQPTDKDIQLFTMCYHKGKDKDLEILGLSDLSIFIYPKMFLADDSFDSGELKPIVPISEANPSDADPDIQNEPLKFTDVSKWGFLRITLSGPEYGFGSTLYPKVISDIALKNGMIIAKQPCIPKFILPANVPFTPLLNNFTATYKASHKYCFDTASKGTYPIQCFLYAPFKNYKVYDNSKKSTNYIYTIGKSQTSDTIAKGIPLWEALNYDGYLFLGFENLLPASSLNLYFELARNYTGAAPGTDIEYYYTGKDGWKKLPLLSDSTNGFGCSGIIKVNVPDDIASNGPAMPSDNYWFCIAVKNNPASFSQTVFFNTNGFTAQRASAFSSTATTLDAGKITKPQTAIPQITSTSQPFPSFGGRAAENNTEMTQRVSNRLKTKDRAVSAADYTTLIKQEFDDVYYSKPVLDRLSKSIRLYLVKAYGNWTDPGAFLPLVTACCAEEVSTFLKTKTSIFSDISVSNFEFQYVRVVAEVSIAPGFEELDISESIGQALNIFLSPWISSNGQQIIIGQEITNTLVANLLNTIEGVSAVVSVLFQTWTLDKLMCSLISSITGDPTVSPFAANNLLVSYMDHDIKFKS